MNRIRVFTLDHKIVNLVEVIKDICQYMVSSPKEKISIDTASEGPCLTHLKFYELLDDLCERFEFDPNLIEITSSNLCETHPRYPIKRSMNFWELEQVREHQFQCSDKKFDSNFKHFGHFIGHGNKYRLELASYLRFWKKDQTLQSFHCDRHSDYHREFFGLEDMIYEGKCKEITDIAKDLIYDAPLHLDPVDEYPILQPANLQVSSYYKNFFVEIVCMTFFSGKVFYTDEKIWRPMMLKTPFMVQGPKNFIPNLRKLGFKTFNRWWDEGYSKDPADCQVAAIIKNCERLSTLNTGDLEKMYIEMIPTLEHNFQRLRTITSRDFYLNFSS